MAPDAIWRLDILLLILPESQWKFHPAGHSIVAETPGNKVLTIIHSSHGCCGSAYRPAYKLVRAYQHGLQRGLRNSIRGRDYGRNLYR